VSMFLGNILLALVWTLMTGRMTPANLAAGFVLSFFALLLTQRLLRGRSAYFRKIVQLLVFAAWFARELIISNLKVAYDVVTPKHHSRPGTIGIPLEVTTSAQITALANLISLTPGTLSLDVSDDRKTLYIHAMFIDDPDKVRREIKEGLERRVLELWS